MTILPLIIDSSCAFVGGRTSAESLLTLPLGRSTVLDRIARRMAGVCEGELLVLVATDRSADYRSRICRCVPAKVQVVDWSALSAKLSGCETADYLLAVEPQYWPAQGYDFEGIADGLRDYRGATHKMALETGSEGVRERVECDHQGHVRRVQRLFPEQNWLQNDGSQIAYSTAPALLAAGVWFNCLSELRRGLFSRGVLSRDIALGCPVLDLARPADYLVLQERVLEETLNGTVPHGYTLRSPGVIVAKGSRIHPSARLVPPVIIQSEVTVDQGTTVIGPSLIGSRSVLRRGSMVAQSVLADRTDLAPGVAVRHCVASGSCNASRAGLEPQAEVAVSMPVPGEHRVEKATGASTEDGKWSSRTAQLTVKRLFDVVAASLALVVLSPLMLLTALLVKITSTGPVFFIHRREGRQGREFPCLKFRTMHADAHKQQRQLYENNLVDGPQFKMRNDPRVTWVGRWLRATNIDELPQFINVVLGHMSLVGPRPSPFRENQICVPWRRARLSVRPGITGLWQVCRDEDRSRGDFHEWIFYDITYVRRFSLWLDVKILLATALTLGGRSSVSLPLLVPQRRRDSVRLSPPVLARH